MSKKKILLTGGAGYVGSITARHLLTQGYDVTVVDRLSFGGDAIVDLFSYPGFTFVKLDLRDTAAVSQLMSDSEFSAVLHLAAIVGDPACAREPEEARAINWDASKYLFDSAIENSVERFVFASTCSNYGKMPDSTGFVDETTPLAPVSLYAELKVEFEDYILKNTSQDIASTALRFSTVYGLSPRMRFDLTVNEFTRDMATGKGLEIFGEQFWRPYCHVKDFARAYELVLASPRDKVANEVFNVGDTSENYTKGMLVEELIRRYPNSPVGYVEKTEDPRDYRVNSDKIRDKLGFEVSLRVPDGIDEIGQVVTQQVISDPYAQRFHNIPV